MDQVPSVEIAVLGEINVRVGGEVVALAGRPAAVLLLLALAGRPVPRRDLWESLKQGKGIKEQTVEKHASDLKTKFGVPVESLRSGGRLCYRLDPARCRVDAIRFVEGVQGLRDTGPGRIDELMGLWRADPREIHPGVAAHWWRPLIEARDTLVRHVLAMDPAARAALDRLGAFTACFPHDPIVDRIRPGGRKRLLIVDDDVEVGRDIHRLLRPYYDCTLLTGEDVLEQWERMIDDPRLHTFDGALIDLHLTGTLNDRRGYVIAAHLRDFTDVPAALVTANATDVSHRRQQATMEEYRLVDIVPKTNPAWHEGVREAARLLTDEDETARRKRLEVFLASAWREVRRRRESLPDGSVGAGRLAGAGAKYQEADHEVRYGAFDVAERLVRRFRHEWRMHP
ncbi:hypothetical protein [Microtetraspora niveoalba]|uniref:hypothetical protein n=1 Tax=Microtetraspora niveoalba TaxID=46175 RepID=UPI000829C180|nr:hypothetical protein [Microtetraspora niveoalba]